MKAKSIKSKAVAIAKAKAESENTRLINHYLSKVWRVVRNEVTV